MLDKINSKIFVQKRYMVSGSSVVSKALDFSRMTKSSVKMFPLMVRPCFIEAVLQPVMAM